MCDLLGVIDMEVCHGGIANYAPIIEYIIINRFKIEVKIESLKLTNYILIFFREPRITAGEVCAAVVGPGCGAWEEINNWSVDIPKKTNVDILEKKNTQGAKLRQDQNVLEDLIEESLLSPPKEMLDDN